MRIGQKRLTPVPAPLSQLPAQCKPPRCRQTVRQDAAAASAPALPTQQLPTHQRTEASHWRTAAVFVKVLEGVPPQSLLVQALGVSAHPAP